MGLKIERVDLKPNGKGVVLQFAQSAASRGGELVDTDNKITIHKEPHGDLVSAFQKLIPHLMYLCELEKVTVVRPEYFDNFTFLDDERFTGVNVTGIVVSGKDRDMIKLIGTKTTSKKQVVSILSPIIWLDDTAENRYVLGDLFRTHYSKAIDEAEKFYAGKYAIEQQEAMQF